MKTSRFGVEYLKSVFLFFCNHRDSDSCGPFLSEKTIQCVSFQQVCNYFHCWCIALVSKCSHTINISARAGGCWVWGRPECWTALRCLVSGCRTVDQGGSSFRAEEQDATKLPEAGQTHAVSKSLAQKGLFMGTPVPIPLSQTVITNTEGRLNHKSQMLILNLVLPWVYQRYEKFCEVLSKFCQWFSAGVQPFPSW